MKHVEGAQPADLRRRSQTVSRLCRAIVEKADVWAAAGFSSLAAVREAHQV
jgi:hypothetical protein